MTSPGLAEEVERFLYQEAEMLDAWRLDEWLTLFHAGSRYEVPSTDRPEGTADNSQLLIADDYGRLQARAHRLESQNAHAERPRSRLSRQVTNVVCHQEVDQIRVRANGVTWRFQLGEADHYVVRYHHLLSRADETSLRFDVRRVELVHERLAPSGRLSFIL